MINKHGRRNLSFNTKSSFIKDLGRPPWCCVCCHRDVETAFIGVKTGGQQGDRSLRWCSIGSFCPAPCLSARLFSFSFPPASVGFWRRSQRSAARENAEHKQTERRGRMSFNDSPGANAAPERPGAGRVILTSCWGGLTSAGRDEDVPSLPGKIWKSNQSFMRLFIFLPSLFALFYFIYSILSNLFSFLLPFNSVFAPNFLFFFSPSVLVLLLSFFTFVLS